MIRRKYYIASKSAHYDVDRQCYYTYVGLNSYKKTLKYLAFGKTEGQALKNGNELADLLNKAHNHVSYS